jgi:PAS domain S-box-containing protein
MKGREFVRMMGRLRGVDSEDAVDRAIDLVDLADAHANIIQNNQAFTELTGYTAEEVMGKSPAILKSDRQSGVFFERMWGSLQRDRSWQGEIWNRRKNGEIFPAWLSITAVVDKDGNVTNYVGAYVDFTERKKAENEIHHLAFYDPLSQLPNRRLLLDRLRQGIASGARNHTGGALMFLDLDNFKTLNDTKGHGIGDLLLIEVSRRLQACVREGDTAKARPITAPSTGSATASAPASVAVAEASSM